MRRTAPGAFFCRNDAQPSWHPQLFSHQNLAVERDLFSSDIVLDLILALTIFCPCDKQREFESQKPKILPCFVPVTNKESLKVENPTFFFVTKTSRGRMSVDSISNHEVFWARCLPPWSSLLRLIKIMFVEKDSTWLC